MAESILHGKGLSIRDQEHLLKENHSLVARWKKGGEERKAQMEQLYGAAAAVASGGIAGYLEGKYPARMQAGGVPISVWASGGLLVLAVSGYAGKESDLVLSAAEGLGAYAAGMAAFKKGQASAQAAPAAAA